MVVISVENSHMVSDIIFFRLLRITKHVNENMSRMAWVIIRETNARALFYNHGNSARNASIWND